MSELTARARAFLAGEALYFKEADALWRGLQDAHELSLARAVLARLRESDREADVLCDAFPIDRALRAELCQQEALLTSKDEELSTGTRHTRAIEILENGFGDLHAEDLTDGETRKRVRTAERPSARDSERVGLVFVPDARTRREHLFPAPIELSARVVVADAVLQVLNYSIALTAARNCAM